MIQENMLAAAVARHHDFKLRDYQEAAIRAVFRAIENDYRRPLIVMPTGAGKTVVFNATIKQWLDFHPGDRIIVQAHRQELVEQGEEKFRRFIGPLYATGIVSAKSNRFDYNAQILFCSKDTIRSKRHMSRLLANGPIALIITDEAHHAEAKSYKGVIEELEAVNPALVHMGVTATPQRGDGKGLGLVFDDIPWYPHGAAFKKELIEMIPEWLAPPRWLAIKTGIGISTVKTTAGDYNQQQLTNVFETPHCLELVVESHKKYAAERKALAFTVSVQGAHDLAALFNEAGIAAAAIDGTMPAGPRAQILRDLASGKLRVVANCAVLTEGFDDPSISCIHMVRPTKSDSLYLQCMGRGLRPRNGHKPEQGEDCLILEYCPADVRNLSQFGHLLGVPEDQQKKLESAERALEEINGDIEIGDVLAGLAYDGQIEMAGVGAAGLEIIAQELDYLNASPWQWTRAKSWLVLGVGASRVTGFNTIFALSPADPDTGEYTVFGLAQRQQYGPWTVRALGSYADFDAASEHAHALADKHADQVLSAKNKRWRNDPATPGQMAFLRRLGGTVGHGQTKGSINEAINVQIVKNELHAAGFWAAYEKEITNDAI